MSEDSKSVTLTRRRLLGATAATGAAAAGLGGGTYALFSDTEQSTGNTIEMGTLDLDASGQMTASSTGSISDLTPGDFFTFSLQLDNVGSIDETFVEFSFDYSVTDTSTNAEADTDDSSGREMGKLFHVSKIEYSLSSQTVPDDTKHIYNETITEYNSTIGDIANSNGYPDLQDLANYTGSRTDDLPGPKSGEYASVAFTVVFIDTDNVVSPPITVASDPTYDGTLTNNQFQGDELDIEVTATLNQKESQSVQ